MKVVSKEDGGDFMGKVRLPLGNTHVFARGQGQKFGRISWGI